MFSLLVVQAVVYSYAVPLATINVSICSMQI